MVLSSEWNVDLLSNLKLGLNGKYDPQNRLLFKKQHTGLFVGVSALALAACGGGGSSSSSGNENSTLIPQSGDGNDGNTLDSTAPSQSLSNTASGFEINEQFALKSAYTAPGYKVFTEASTEVAFASDAYGLLFMNAVADFNNDGRDDILMDYADTLTTPIFLTSNGDGTFSDSVTVIGDVDVRTIRNTTVVDLNNDGFLDVVAFTAPHGWQTSALGELWDGSESDIIYYNQNGTSFNAVPISFETYNHGGDVGDLNGDGIYEIFSLAEWPGITPYTSENGFRGLLTQDADGNYVQSSNVLPDEFVNLVTSDMRIGDINGDGFDDLIIAISPEYNKGNTPMTSSDIGSFKVGVSDGTLNISNYTWTTYGTHPMSESEWEDFKAQYTNNEVTDQYDETGTFGGVGNIELIDINDDGQLDVIASYIVQYNGGWVWSGFSVYENQSGVFSDQTSIYVPDQSGNRSTSEVTSAVWRIFKEDINSDGNGDLIIQTQTSEQSWQFTGDKSHTIYINEDGVYKPASRENLDVNKITGKSDPNSLNQVRTGDFNGDSATDLAFNVVYGAWDSMEIMTLTNVEVI